MEAVDKLLNNKLQPSVIGFLQALAVFIYVIKVAAFIFFITQTLDEPGYFGIVLMLVLLVFSAGVTGTLVFGLPVYYALKNEISRAVSILIYTFLYTFAIIVATVLFIFSFT